MSAALVKSKDTPHTFVDDLESIFYVILWLSLLYSPHSMSSSMLTSFVRRVFDPEQYEGTGGTAKVDFLKSQSDLEQLVFQKRPLLQPLLINLATLFAVRYEAKPSDKQKALIAKYSEDQHELPAWKYQERISQLKSHAHTIQLLDDAIADAAQWPADDPASSQVLLPRPQEDKKRKTKTGFDLAQSERPMKKIRD
jgi:hypothetical protein